MSALLIGLTGCSEKDIPAGNGNSGDVIFRAVMNPSVRSTETEFEANDAIGVFAVRPDGTNIDLRASNYADNVKHIFDGVSFRAEGDGIKKDEDEYLAYYAVYPYQVPCGASFNFVVAADQSTHEAYTSGDLCTVSTTALKEAEVELKFYHRLSRLVVNVSGFNIAGNLDMELINVYSGAIADLNSNTFTADPSSEKINIKANQESANSYSVIIPPQTIAANQELVKVNLNGREFRIKTPSALEFASGRSYSLNATVINGEIVLGTGQIVPWDNQTVEDKFTENFFAIEDANFVNAEFTEGSDSSDPFEISANESALAGGMNFITINCDQEYEAFELSVKGQTGYWEYYPESATTRSSHSYTIPILYGTSFAQDMEMLVCGRKQDGTKSIGYNVNFNYVESKSGDLNINLTFSTPKDVDLHLYTPSGKHIYYGDRGGTTTIDGESVEYGLDHDSNAACSLDYLNNENIFIPAQLIEEGTYRVVVNMYSNCDHNVSCDWSVVARYRGEIIPNEMDGLGNPVADTYSPSCGSGDMTTVMTFTLHPGTNQNRVRNLLQNMKVTPRKLTKAEKDKIEDDYYDNK